MSRTQRLRNTIIIIALLLLFVAASFQRPAVSLFWRQVRHSNRRPYRAPMIGCDTGDAIPGNYFVFLHQRSSLAEHQQTVRASTDLETKFTHIWPVTDERTIHWPWIYRPGLTYVAENIDDAALEAIRADVVVDFIECNRLVYAVTGEDVVEIS